MTLKNGTINLANLAKIWRKHMTKVNMFEAKSDLSKLIKMLETKEEDVIYLSRSGKIIAQITLVPESKGRRLGVAKGKITIPDEFDEWDKEIEGMFNL